MDRMANDIAARFDQIDNTTRVALAYNHEVNESKTLANLQHIADRLSRQYLRLLKAFQNLRENPIEAPAPPPEPEAEIRKNEPEASDPAKVVEFPGPERKSPPQDLPNEPEIQQSQQDGIAPNQPNEPGTDGIQTG